MSLSAIRRSAGVLAVLLVTGIVAAAVVVLVRQPAVLVVIRNNGNQPISNVELTYRGGRQVLPTITPGAEGRTSVCPKGDSGLSICFADPSGNEVAQDIDTYIAPNMAGVLELEITANGEVLLTRDDVAPSAY